MIIPLNEPIQCEDLCKIIQKTIDKHIKETGSPANALSVKIVDVIESTTQIPKLENKDV